MADAFSEWRYVPVDIDSGALPERFHAASSSPTNSSTRCRWRSRCIDDGAFREQLVAFADGALPLGHRRRRSRRAANDYLRRYFPPPEEGRWYEANLEALAWMERIARSLD